MRGLPHVFFTGGGSGPPPPPPGAQAIRVLNDDDYVILDPYTDSIAQYSFTGWARILSADELPHCPFAEVKGSGFTVRSFNVLYVAHAVGPTISFRTGGSLTFPDEAPDVNRWFFFSFSKNNSSIDCRWCYLEETSFAAARSCGNESSFGSGPATEATAGEYVDNAGVSLNPLVGDFCQIRRWSTNLSEAELLAEKNSATVVKTASLYSSNPFAGAADMSDESGNGRVGFPNNTLIDVMDGPGN